MRPGKRFAVPGLVYPQGPAAEFLAVEIGNRSIRILHVHKPEAAGSVTFAMGNNFDRTNGADFFEMKLDISFSRIMGKVAHKNFLYHDTLLRASKGNKKACPQA